MGDYDPFSNRDVPRPTNDIETVIHFLKSAFGLGILAVPEAYKNAGIVSASISTVLIGYLITYCVNLLFASQYVLCQRDEVPYMDYKQSFIRAIETGPLCMRKLAHCFGVSVDVFLIVSQFGGCTVFILFVVETLQSIFDPDKKWSLTIWSLMLLPFFIAINLFRNLKKMVPLSVFANILTFISYAIILSYLFRDLPSISTVKPFNKDYFLYFGVMIFAFNMIGVVIPLEANMKTPQHFRGTHGVLCMSMTFIIFLYSIVGFFGYWRYGDRTARSITYNLPESTVVPTVVRALYATAIAITFGLNAFLPVQLSLEYMNPLMVKCGLNLLVMEYIFRVLSVCIMTLLALMVPLLSLIISLLGAFLKAPLLMTIPALMDICVRYPDNYGVCKFHFIKALLIIMISLMVICIATYFSMSALIKAIIEMHKK